MADEKTITPEQSQMTPDNSLQPESADPNINATQADSGDAPKYNPPDFDSIGPALSILKELLARAQERREQDAHNEAASESLEFEQMNAQVIAPINTHIYVSLDGDGIGNQVMQAEERNDEKTLAEVSRKINAGQDVLVQWAIRFGGKVIEAGGDEGLVRVPGAAVDQVEDLRKEYFNAVGATATVGVGETIRECTQARMLGKLRGKDRVVIFDDNVPRELKTRLEMAGDLTPEKKLLQGGLGSSVTKENPGPKL